MANFEHRHAQPGQSDKLVLRTPQYLERQSARASGKIVYSLLFHLTGSIWQCGNGTIIKHSLGLLGKSHPVVLYSYQVISFAQKCPDIANRFYER
jgi:hypothetical protein